MKNFASQYTDTDVVLIELHHLDSEFYLANTFSCSQLRCLAEHADRQTREFLRSESTGLSAKLLGHGIRLNLATPDDTHRSMTQTDKTATRIGRSIASLQQSLTDLADIAADRATKHSHPI